MNNAKVQIYPNGRFKITLFSSFIYDYKLTEIKKEERKKKINETKQFNKENNIKSTTRYDSIKRARDKIFDIAYLNADTWTHMVTFTLDKNKIDRYNADIVCPVITNWLKHSASRKNLFYLIVPELHKDGAIHFHGLINAGNLNLEDSGLFDYDGRKIFNVKDFKYGFSTAVPLDDNKIAVCKYITKYINKDLQNIMGKMYYSGGKGIIRDTESYTTTIDCTKPYTLPNGIEIDLQSIPWHEVPYCDMKVKYITCGGL